MKTVDLDSKCFSCGEWYAVKVSTERLDRWISGDGFVQDIWPEYDYWYRERLLGWKTGMMICENCSEQTEKYLEGDFYNETT